MSDRESIANQRDRQMERTAERPQTAGKTKRVQNTMPNIVKGGHGGTLVAELLDGGKEQVVLAWSGQFGEVGIRAHSIRAFDVFGRSRT